MNKDNRGGDGLTAMAQDTDIRSILKEVQRIKRTCNTEEEFLKKLHDMGMILSRDEVDGFRLFVQNSPGRYIRIVRTRIYENQKTSKSEEAKRKAFSDRIEELLGFVVPADELDEVIGDVTEKYYRFKEKRGTIFAGAWVAIQIFILIVCFVVSKVGIEKFLGLP